MTKKINILPSNIRSGGFFASEWQNSERETIAANIVFISRVNGDKWFRFSWEDYKRMCKHDVTDSEHTYLEYLKDERYLEGTRDRYKPTEKFILALMKYLKEDVEIVV